MPLKVNSDVRFHLSAQPGVGGATLCGSELRTAGKDLAIALQPASVPPERVTCKACAEAYEAIHSAPRGFRYAV